MLSFGFNRAVHFISVEAKVRDIVNLAIIATMDAAVSGKAPLADK